VRRRDRILAALLSFAFLFALSRTITSWAVSADNAAANTAGSDSVSAAATATLQPPQPPYVGVQSVVILRETTVVLGDVMTFLAIANPISATLPITFTWEATQRPTEEGVVRSRQGGFYAAWDRVGTEVITVTVSNIAGSAVATNTLVIPPATWPPVPPQLSIIELVPIGSPLTRYVEALVDPPTVTLPITYTYEASGLLPEVHAALVRTWDGHTFVWPTPGRKVVTITVSNLGGTVSTSFTETVRGNTYFPLVYK
jgi:hypothetical protein